MKLFIHAFFSVIVKIYYSGTVKKIRERKLAKISARAEESRITNRTTERSRKTLETAFITNGYSDTCGLRRRSGRKRADEAVKTERMSGEVLC